MEAELGTETGVGIGIGIGMEKGKGKRKRKRKGERKRQKTQQRTEKELLRMGLDRRAGIVSLCLHQDLARGQRTVVLTVATLTNIRKTNDRDDRSKNKTVNGSETAPSLEREVGAEIGAGLRNAVLHEGRGGNDTVPERLNVARSGNTGDIITCLQK